MLIIHPRQHFFLSRLTWPVWTLGLWMVLYAPRGRVLCIQLTSYNPDALCSLQDLSATSPLQVNETGARSGVLTALLNKDSYGISLRDLPSGLELLAETNPRLLFLFYHGMLLSGMRLYQSQPGVRNPPRQKAGLLPTTMPGGLQFYHLLLGI